MNCSSPRFKQYVSVATGYTLLELLIVMIIVGILASATVPAYQSVLLKNQRAEGQALLLQTQSYFEKYYISYQRYPADLTALSASGNSILNSEHDYYVVNLDAPSAACPALNCYRLIAEHKSKEPAERLVLYSSGKKEGKWSF